MGVINVITVECGFYSANTYIVYDDKTLDAVIVDAGGDYKKIINKVKSRSLNIRALLLTHGHFDHILSAKEMQDNNIKVYVHEDDAEKLQENTYSKFGVRFSKLQADVFIKEGNLKFGSIDVDVIHTPGHSKGGVCYIIGGNIFSGDSLFRLNIGRTDFTDGDYNALMHSLCNKLFVLDKDYTVYPGHGDSTTLFFEKENNPYNIK